MRGGDPGTGVRIRWRISRTLVTLFADGVIVGGEAPKSRVNPSAVMMISVGHSTLFFQLMMKPALGRISTIAKLIARHPSKVR